MNVIARPRLEEFKKAHAVAREWLDAWWLVASKAQWTSLDDVRRQYASADQVGRCLVFDACGNRFRLIVGVAYAGQYSKKSNGTLFVREFLTHAEYDKGAWKKHC